MLAGVLRSIRKTHLMEPFPPSELITSAVGLVRRGSAPLELYAERLGVGVEELR